MKLLPATDEHGSPVSFQTLMALEKVDDLTFQSTTKAFQPGGPMSDAGERPRAYGGHVYSQAVWAAAQTVRDGFLSVSGFFLLMGFVDNPFIYTVRKLRDGGSYCTRAVDVRQHHTEGVTFTCTCSFKKADATPFEFQERIDLDTKFAEVLRGKRPEDHPAAPSIESPWFKGNPEARRVAAPFPGLRTQKVDMQAYNDHRLPLERRKLIYYSALGVMPPASSSPNLHACAHLYASDRNSLFTITDGLNLTENRSLMASLNHTVIFHTSVDALSMSGSANDRGQGSTKWFVQEAWTDRLGDGRGTHHSKLWDLRGRHVATTMQDGMVRLKYGSDEELQRTKEAIESGRAKM